MMHTFKFPCMLAAGDHTEESLGAGVSAEDEGGMDGDAASDDMHEGGAEEAQPSAAWPGRQGRRRPPAARLPRLQPAIQPGRTEAGAAVPSMCRLLYMHAANS